MGHEAERLKHAQQLRATVRKIDEQLEAAQEKVKELKMDRRNTERELFETLDDPNQLRLGEEG